MVCKTLICDIKKKKGDIHHNEIKTKVRTLMRSTAFAAQLCRELEPVLLGAHSVSGRSEMTSRHLQAEPWPTAQRACQGRRGECTEALHARSHCLAFTLPVIVIYHRIVGLITLFRNKHVELCSWPLSVMPLAGDSWPRDAGYCLRCCTISGYSLCLIYF